MDVRDKNNKKVEVKDPNLISTKKPVKSEKPIALNDLTSNQKKNKGQN
ncbi:MAG TPA: hypothetical protein VLH94_04190 [Spirochaetia bacterium]|nr:hypothetical protein [Spirochaetia bacterium]